MRRKAVNPNVIGNTQELAEVLLRHLEATYDVHDAELFTEKGKTFVRLSVTPKQGGKKRSVVLPWGQKLTFEQHEDRMPKLVRQILSRDHS